MQAIQDSTHSLDSATKTWFVEGNSVVNFCFILLVRERVPFKCEPVPEVPGQWWKFTVPVSAPEDCRPAIAYDQARRI